jgi:hypothetical protein
MKDLQRAESPSCVDMPNWITLIAPRTCTISQGRLTPNKLAVIAKRPRVRGYQMKH